MYLETLKERDAYEIQHLGGYDVVYPPMKNNNTEIDQEKMAYYKQFMDHAKKFMMDFKVCKQEQ